MSEEVDVMQGDAGLAFGMVIGAGLCTSLGAALAFVVPLEVNPVAILRCGHYVLQNAPRLAWRTHH